MISSFHDKVIYQIYPKSFFDTNGDGMGDLRGVTSKLDYVADLGVDLIWLTPFFVSPQNDNGYDVADYRAVDPCFGTMSDLEELISGAAQRGMGIMLDMVFNHTSTTHEWFRRALAGEQKYQDYYIFRAGSPDQPPTNWQSKFGGSAWEYVPTLGKWYLHLFDVTQADLNWENPAVREELKAILHFWKEKGIQGFRFDVVNLISKPAVFEDDPLGDGRRFYTDGHHVHDFLKELVQDAGIEEMVTVGEMSSTCLEHCVRYSDPAEKELSMCFHFHHLKVDYPNGNKWELMPPDHRELKRLLMDWQTGMQAHNGWSALFWCNHDQPRIVSRFGDTGRYWKQSAKMLATCIHMLRGTPYIYQGEELGMTNPGYVRLEEYRDVESLHYYALMRQAGKTEQEAINILRSRSRDNGRSPMQWSGEKYAGFSLSAPWIGVTPNYDRINAEAEKKDPDSILHYYKRLVALRKQHKVISEGSVSFVYPELDNVFAYYRKWKTQELLVFNNLSEEVVHLPDKVDIGGWQCLICNDSIAPQESRLCRLPPYASFVFYRDCAECGESKTGDMVVKFD